MKKLLILILVLTLPLIVFFQYKSYRRFHPPADYEYAISEEIDVNYYNQDLVSEYFSKSIEIGSFARTQWSNHGIDVRYPDEANNMEMNASKYYNQLLMRVSMIEKKLLASSSWKQQGFGNEQISVLESGMEVEDLKWIEDRDQITSIEFGNQSQYVWVVQKELIAKGYEHKLDGLFGIDTQNAIRSFQEDIGLYPSGTINEDTFKELFLK